jgi:hypothetical protein
VPVVVCSFWVNFVPEREEREEVSKNYKTGSFMICAAERIIFD